MVFEKNVQLSKYDTMRIGGAAKYLCHITSEQELLEALHYASTHKLNTFVLGKGSNTVFTDNGYNGLVIINDIAGIKPRLGDNIIESGAGELWDDIVELAVNNDFAGTEALSLIPGTIGAAPINNIGAYGQEIKDTLYSLRAYDKYSEKFVELNNSDCLFGYRDSIFKSKEYGRYIITKVVLKHSKYNIKTYLPPTYPSLQQELNSKNGVVNLKDVREAVIKVRTSKLPDPKTLANTGSFFKNPIVSSDIANALKKAYPDLPVYDFENRKKLAAGWLIEKAGLKGYSKNGIAIYDKQALVIVNESSNSYKDLKDMIDYITNTIYQNFGVKLELEPEII